ncbi:MAG: hypothetical protein WA030_02455 [Candidatus Microsaccharimonas sp.]
MSNDIPAWVTATGPIVSEAIDPFLPVLGFGVIVVAALITLVVLAPRIGATIGRQITNALIVGRRDELEQLTREINDADTILKQARAITQTAAAFEIDEALSLKMRQALSALRVAQLQHAYDALLRGLKASYAELATMRGRQASATTSSTVSYYAGIVKHLNVIIADQEQQVRNLEPLLDQWGVAHTRLTSKLHAV